MRISVLALSLMLAWSSAVEARQMGKYSKPISPACMEKIKTLSSAGGGNCCASADGWEATEAVWDIKKGSYVVIIDAVTYELKDDVVLKEANCSGMAIVWYYWPLGEHGEIIKKDGPVFRCFWPGPESRNEHFERPSSGALFLGYNVWK